MMLLLSAQNMPFQKSDTFQPYELKKKKKQNQLYILKIFVKKNQTLIIMMCYMGVGTRKKVWFLICCIFL